MEIDCKTVLFRPNFGKKIVKQLWHADLLVKKLKSISCQIIKFQKSNIEHKFRPILVDFGNLKPDFSFGSTKLGMSLVQLNYLDDSCIVCHTFPMFSYEICVLSLVKKFIFVTNLLVESTNFSLSVTVQECRYNLMTWFVIVL